VAQALAARDGRIVAVGRDGDVAPLAGPGTEVVDLHGRTAIPGIVDSHCHPDSWAVRLAKWRSLRDPALRSTRDVLALVAGATRDSPPDTWFLGYRFDDQKLGGYPSRADLDAAGHGRPVFILRADGHLGLASTRAFELVGVGRDRPDPPFGRFDRHPETGELTGLVRETAAHLFLGAVGAGDTVADHVAGLERVFAEFLEVGITSLHNSLASSQAIQAYQVLRAGGRLPLRVGLLVSGREAGLVEAVVRAGIRSGFGDEWLRVVGVEWCVDCSTSGRTAAYYAPYGGTPVVGEPAPNHGMLLYDAGDLARRVAEAHRAGLQVCLDGVGDRGIDFCLDAMEAALGAHPVADHRMRVEHCCCVPPPILARLRRLGVIDSSAAGFMYDLGDAYVAQRGAGAMAWMWPHRALIDAGVPAPAHSDAPICRPDPFPAIWSMVTRQTDTGRPLGPAQAVTVEEALRAYTWLGAFAGREEHLKGSLEPGKLADVAVLDRDVLTVPADLIRETRVDLTIVGGVVRFRR
jgi:predicted amidohydrolase YtcJ